jgi:hypothetical protein
MREKVTKPGTDQRMASTASPGKHAGSTSLGTGENTTYNQANVTSLADVSTTH